MTLVAAPALFLLAGLPLTAALRRARGRVAARLGWAYVLGVAYLGVALYAGSHLAGLPLRRGPILAIACVPAAALALSRAVRRAPSARSTAAWTRPATLELLALALGAAAVAGVLAETTSNPFGAWDDRATWAAHARYIRGAGSVDAPAFRDAWVTIEHPRYPALLPLAQVAVAEVFDTGDERTLRTLYGWMLAAFLAVLGSEARARAGRPAAAIAVGCAALLPMLAFEGDGGAVSGYADVPLGLFWGGAVLLLSGRPRGRGTAALAALLLAATVLAKDEGLALATVALLALSLRPAASLARAAARRRASRVRRLLPALLVPAAGIVLAALLLQSWRTRIPVRLEPNFGDAITPALVAKGIAARYPLLLAAMLREMQRPDRWGLFFMTAPLVLALGRRALGRRRVLEPALAAAGALAAYGIGYAATRLNPFSMVLVTWSRFLLQVALVVLVLFAATLAEALARPRLGLASALAAALCLFTPATRALRVPLRWDEAGLAPKGAAPPAAPLPPGLPRPVRPAPDDPSLPAAIDEPAEGATVSGPLLARGWSQTESARGEVLDIRVDGVRVAPASFARVPRPDVARALPRLGACNEAGWEARLDTFALVPGAHELTIRFLAGARQRALTRRFHANP